MMNLKTPLLAAALALGASACASDYAYDGRGRSYGHADSYREYRSWPSQHYNGRYYYQHPQRGCWYAPDNDNNPPGPAGGPGTNWENPPGPRGGPGASPDRNRCR